MEAKNRVKFSIFLKEYFNDNSKFLPINFPQKSIKNL